MRRCRVQPATPLMSKFILKKSQEPHDFRNTDYVLNPRKKQATLEPQRSHKVNHPLVAGNGSCDSTEAGRVKLRVAIGEVCVVENVDERRLDFKAHRLANREALGDAHISGEKPTTVEAVHREIAKLASRRRSQQSWFEC